MHTHYNNYTRFQDKQVHVSTDPPRMGQKWDLWITFFLFQLSSKVKRLSRQSFKIEDKQYYEIHPVISAASCTLFLIPEHFSRQLSPSCSAIRVVVGAVVVA